MSLIFENFSMEAIIIVFTHCDLIDKKDDPSEKAQAWMKLLNDKIKSKIKTNNIVLFGKNSGE